MVGTQDAVSGGAAADPWAPALAEAIAGLSEAVEATGVSLDSGALGAQLELTEGLEFDLALPVFRAAKSVGRRPEELAQALADHFPVGPTLQRAQAVGAYLNIAVDRAALTRRTLDLVHTRGTRFGHGEPGGTAACVEHTSANPTGPFHVGRVRNAIIGDTLARTLRAAGRNVVTQYYVDDMGRQSAMITWIWSKPEAEWPAEIRKAVGELPPLATPVKADALRGRPYPAVSAYLKAHPEARDEVAQLVRAIEEGRAPPLHHQLMEEILAGMLASLGRIGVGFDEFVWESSLLGAAGVDPVLARLRAGPHAIQEANGAWAIDASTYGLPLGTRVGADPHDEPDVAVAEEPPPSAQPPPPKVIFSRADGTSLYVTRDVAYHLQKFARFPLVIDVLGQDHQLHARTLVALLEEIGDGRRPAFVIYQDLTIPGGGRMSTRAGSAVWFDALIDEAIERARSEVLKRREDLDSAEVERVAEAVGTGAIRYHVARIAPEKPVVFRWDDALSFEGRSGPFAQYAYARASSILRKAVPSVPPFPFDPERLTGPEEQTLLRIIARWPRTVAYVARTYHVHAIAGYAHALADQFNRFYHAVPVLTSGDDRESRLALVSAARTTLGNALDVLGIPRLETM